MENLSGKRALVILTNEAFLPRGGRGGHNPHPRQPSNNSILPDGPVMQYSPSANIPSIPTIHNPPQSYSVLPNPEGLYEQMHRKTGIDILEVGYFWLKFAREAGVDMTFVSPRGGPVALDPISIDSMEKDTHLRDRLKEEREFMSKLGHTYPISWIRPEDYDLVLIPGGHGAMFDLPEQEEVAAVICKVYAKGGYIAAIGHGVSALLNVPAATASGRIQTSEYLLKGKKVTCYTNAEEKEKRFDEFLPFLLEDRVRERGAQLQTAKPFTPNVVVDERLITGQSWPSIHEFVKKIGETCHRKQ